MWVAPAPLGAAETKPKPPLNRSERALYEVLRVTPHYKYGEVLLNLTLSGQAEFGIGSELTPDSLDKLASYLTDLPAVVEAGKKFRIDHLNHIAVRGEVAAFDGTGIDRNPSARVLRTYYQMVRAYNRKTEVAPTEKQVAPTAYDFVRILHGHLPGSSISDWPTEHQEEYQTKIEKLIRFTTRATPTRELPENIFKAWRSAELKRVKAQRQKIIDLQPTVVSRDKSPGVARQAGEYQESLLSSAEGFCLDTKTVLDSTDSQAKMKPSEPAAATSLVTRLNSRHMVTEGCPMA